MSEPTVIAGTDTRYAQLLAQRSALKLEAMGMRRSGPSLLSRLRKVALELTDPKTGAVIETIDPLIKSRTARGAYAELNELIVRLLGSDFDRPLPAGFKRIMP